MVEKNEFNLIKVVSRYSFMILILILLAYNILWDYIEISRFLSFNSYVYDAGVFMENAYQFVHLNSFNIPLLAKVSQIIQRPFLYLISPISLLPSYYNYDLFFVLQSLFISLPALFIYEILKVKGFGNLISLTMGALYLFYFPMSGPNFFDLHSATAFLPFLFAGVYYYYRNSLKLSLILLLIASLVRYPFSIFSLLFGFSNLFLLLFLGGKGRKKDLIFSLTLIFFSAVILAVSYAVIVRATNYTATDIHIYSYSFSSFLNNIPQNLKVKIITLFLYFLPLSFIPLLSKRFLILYLPFIIYLFVSNFTTLLFPQAFLYQYPLLIAPFIYLGLIDVMINKNENRNAVEKKRIKIIYNKKITTYHKIASIVISVLILTTATAVVYEPYSPANPLSKEQFFLGNPFNFSNSIEVTKADQIFAQSLPYLVPATDPYVLVENNIPQVYPRMLPYFNTPLVGDGNVIGNVNLSSVRNNSYPIFAENKWVYTKIDYVIADVLNPGGFYTGYPGIPGGPPDSINYFVNLMLESGYYGIEAEIGGFLVLERNYTAPPKIFYPLNINLLHSNDYPFENPLSRNSKVINLKTIDVNGSLDLKMNYFTLPPGTYQVKINGSILHNSKVLRNASVLIEVVGQFGYEKFLPPYMFSVSDSEFNGTLEFTVSDNSYIGFCSVDLEISGIYGIVNVNTFYIHQIS